MATASLELFRETYLGSQVFRWKTVKQVNASILVPSDGVTHNIPDQLKDLRREMSPVRRKGAPH